MAMIASRPMASMCVYNPFLLENNALEFDLHVTKMQRKCVIFTGQ
jgi:hypothetical protein